MIRNRTMYDLYVAYNDLKVKNLEIEIKETEKACKKVLTILKPYLERVHKLIDYNLFLLGKVPKLPKECLTHEDKYINVQVKLYYRLYSSFPDKKLEVKRLKESIIDYSTFNFIINTFNERLSDEMVYNKYEFEQSTIGKICIVKNRTKNNYIDWGNSNINKAKLLEEGKIPYIKEDEKKAIEQGIEYKGEPWLVYHTHRNLLYMAWNINTTGAKGRIPNLVNYTLKAANHRTEKSKTLLTKLLRHSKEINTDQYNLYKEHA